MARVLAISSQVVRGHVGLSAIVPALQRQGHEAWPLPTVLLSNHLGHPRFHGVRIAPEELTRITAALDSNGWLDQLDAVITGYLPSQDHVRAAGEVIRRLKAQRTCAYLCDPVIGDAPKGVYIDIHAARAIRDVLVPLADIVTPNRFELGWLTGQPCDTLEQVQSAARTLPNAVSVVTSAEVGADRVVNLMLSNGVVQHCAAVRHAHAPHGTGDLLAGLLLGHILNGESAGVALGRAVAGVDAVIAASAGMDELVLHCAADWATAPPHAVMTPARGLARAPDSKG